MKLNRKESQNAMTRVDVIVTIVVLAVLAGVVLAANFRSRPRAQRSLCLNYLMQIGLSARQWAIDNKNSFPMGLSTNLGGTQEYTETDAVFRHFQALSNELNTPFILACPRDVRRPAKDFVTLSNTNISYFVSLNADPIHLSMFLAGDRNLTNDAIQSNGILELKSNSAVGWTEKVHDKQGNIALADGSVQGLSNMRLSQAVQEMGVATNRLALPLD